jgi:hypothetical protein
MFWCQRIGAPQCGQAERGVTRLYLAGAGAYSRGQGLKLGDGGPRFRQHLLRLRPPLPVEHDRQAVDDHVQEAADQQRQQERAADEQRGDLLQHVGGGQITAPSLKMGRYMAMTRPPTSTPRITMISGSSRLERPSTAASTSAS